MSTIRRKAAEGLKAGDVFRVRRTFTREDAEAFARVSRDYNPVHFDDRFAGVKQLRGRICQGLLVAGMATEIGGQIGWLASEMRFRFRRPVYFGDTVECSVTIVDIDAANRARAEATFRNQDGEVVIEALLRGVVPGEPERAVLEAMLAEGDPTNPCR